MSDTVYQDIRNMHLAEIGHEILPEDEIRDLVRKAHEGDEEARNRVVEHNLRLVYHVASDVMGDDDRFMDAIQEGYVNILEKVVEGFDPERGVKFSTYATHALERTMSRVRGNSSTIEVSNSTEGNKRKIEEYMRDKEETSLSQEDVEELSEELGIREGGVRLALLYMGWKEKSMEALAENDEEKRFKPGTKTQVHEETSLRGIKDCVKRALADLSLEKDNYLDKRTLEVFYHRIYERKNLREAGESFEVTFERVRQLEKKALSDIEERAQEHISERYGEIDGEINLSEDFLEGAIYEGISQALQDKRPEVVYTLEGSEDSVKLGIRYEPLDGSDSGIMVPSGKVEDPANLVGVFRASRAPYDLNLPRIYRKLGEENEGFLRSVEPTDIETGELPDREFEDREARQLSEWVKYADVGIERDGEYFRVPMEALFYG